MVWLIIVLLILVVILGTAFVRNSYLGYRNGAGNVLKNSEYNMDEKEELSDKEYYDENKGLFK